MHEKWQQLNIFEIIGKKVEKEVENEKKSVEKYKRFEK